MKFDQAIDLFIEDRRVQGRITSANTIKAYRSDLGVLVRTSIVRRWMRSP